MRANPIIAGLWIALIALLGAGVALVRSRRAPPPAIEPPDDDQPPASRPRPREAPRRPAARAGLARPACAPKPGRACVVGRIEFPRDVPEHPAFQALSLKALGIGAKGDGDDDRDQDGAIGLDGTFRLDLAAGDYGLEVSGRLDAPPSDDKNDDEPTGENAGDRAADDADQREFTGGLDLLRAEPDAVIDDVVIAVRPALSIRGTLRGVQGIPVSDAKMTIRRSGRPGATTDASPLADGSFRLGGLREGSYDLGVDGASSYRRWSRSGVGAPADGLIIDLARRPILLGSVGAEPDGSCPTAALSLGDGIEVQAVLSLTDLCTFASQPLPDGDRFLLAGTVGDTPLRQWVTIPAAGDPAPVCLLGPCAAEPAALVVVVAKGDAPAQGQDQGRNDRQGRGGDQGPGDEVELPSITIGYELVTGESDNEGRLGETTGDTHGLTYFDDLPSGRSVRLWAEGGDQRAEQTVFVRPGVNEIALHLSPR